MRKNIQRINALILVLMLALSVAPMLTDRAFAAGTAKYIERTWDGSKVDEKSCWFNDEYPDEELHDVTNSTTTLNSGWWVSSGKKTISSRLKVSGDVKLILDGELTCSNGINVPSGSTLTIYGGSDKYDVLRANIPSGSGHAAIGGNSGANGGNIIIKSGNISTYGNRGSGNAGIGGGNNATFEKIEILGGTLAAHGLDLGPGIGNGAGYRGGTSGEVIIYGGDITAHAGNGAAGIGGGYDAYGVKTTIWGGTVSAEGVNYTESGLFASEYSGAGIGGGGNRGQSRDIYIYGGTVTAKGGSGLGSGGAGIGSGSDSSGGKVVIGGKGLNCDVKAIGGTNAAGIGAGTGEDKDGCNVEFISGVLEAYANGGTSTSSRVYAISGCGGGNNRTLKIPDNAKVTYGDTLNGSKTVALKNERVNMAQSKNYAKINGCEHSDCTYTEIDAYKHKVECKHCLYTTEKAHSYEGDGTTCTKGCGFKGFTLTFIPGTDGEGTEYTKTVRPGTFEVPENKDFTPKNPSYVFDVWTYISEDDIENPGEAEPRDSLDITADTVFAAKWKKDPNIVSVTIRWSSIDGKAPVEPMTITLKKGDETISGIGYDKLLEIYEHFASVEGYKPMEVKQGSLPMLLTSKPIDSYADIWEAQDDNWYGKYIEEDTVLFMPMAMPAEKISFRVEKPLCGTKVRVIGSGAERIQEGAPVVTVKDDSHVELADEKLNAFWTDPENMESMVLDNQWLQGDFNYPAMVHLQERIGYYIDGENLPTVTMENAVEDSIETEMLEAGYFEFKVEAVHKISDTPVAENRLEPGCEEDGSYDEVYYCKGHDQDGPCGKEYSSEPKTIPATGHSWGEWSVTREPTETVEGEKTRTCKYDARHTETRSIPVKSHTHGLEEFAALDATCTEAGHIKYWQCSTGEAPCGRYFSDAEGANEIDLNDTVIAALGHNYGDWDQTKAPTCSAEGTEMRTCTRDATHTESRAVAVDPSAHSWGDWEQTKTPTCSVPGEKTRTCEHNSNHKETKPVAVDPEAHDWDEWRTTTVATALRDGVKTRTCKNNAGHQETKPIPAIKDILEIYQVTQNAVGNQITATAKVLKPDPDGKVDDEVTGRTARATTKFDNTSVTSSILNASNITGSKILSGSAEGTQHTISMILATRTNPARSITNKAEKTITVITPKLSLSSTCLADGEATITVSDDQNQTIKYFKDSGGEVKDSDVYNAKTASGASFTVSEPGTYYVFTAPSQDGDTFYTRSFLSLRDGAVPDSIEVKEHDWSDWMHTKDPTCADPGEEERICSKCSVKEEQEVAVDPNAHQWNDGEVTTEPSCTKKGVITYTCEHNDEHTKTGEIDALGHDWSEWKVTKAPTQTSEGKEERVCSRCKNKETRPIKKLNPTPTKKVSGTLIARATVSGKKALKYKWTKVNNVSGYDVFMSRCNYKGKTYVPKKVKSIKGNKTFTWTQKKLAKNTAYKAYVKAYVYKNGKKTYVRTSPMIHVCTGNSRKSLTNPKSISINRSALNLKKGKTATLKGKVTKVKSALAFPDDHAKRVRFLSSNKKVATVNKNGKVKAVGKGTCKIYVYAQNGIWKVCKVTVR